ncbi:hypothetical protein G6F65_022830 [Rhizopus arrhizus]|nr:hypothetical protein G6F65_022830 [Rhizopus arrhizus]
MAESAPNPQASPTRAKALAPGTRPSTPPAAGSTSSMNWTTRWPPTRWPLARCSRSRCCPRCPTPIPATAAPPASLWMRTAATCTCRTGATTASPCSASTRSTAV